MVALKLTPQLRKDILEWDTINWGRGVEAFEKAHIDCVGKRVLDIGSRNGGLALYFALKGAHVVCSDLEKPGEDAEQLHKKYGVEDLVIYEAVDATKMEYENEFDIVCFKSVLGGIGYGNNAERQKLAVSLMYKALVPGGYLMFCENLKASPLHRLLRKKFVKWGTEWRYVSSEEVEDLCSEFETVATKQVGFLGALGRNHTQRSILGCFDKAFDFLVPKSWRYIYVAILKKNY